VNRKKGFTLLEVLIVSVLLIIFEISIYTTFNNGIKVWKLLNTKVPEEDIILFFEKLSYDFKNSFSYKTLPFKGNSEKISFPTIIVFSDSKKIKKGIGEVNYYFDKYNHSLFREQANYSQIYQNKKSEPFQIVNEIKDLVFMYYGYDEEKKIYRWKNKWEEKTLPIAIRIIIEYKDGKITKTISR